MKAHILVVDDEPITRQSLTDILRLEGFTVSSVPNGEAAVDYIRMYSVDLIILDLRMPGLGGMEVVRVLGQMSPDTEIILLTAHGSMETAVDALRHRVHDYLLKPASPKQILESVERGLIRRELRLEQRKKGETETTDISPTVVQFDGWNCSRYHSSNGGARKRNHSINSGRRSFIESVRRKPR